MLAATGNFGAKGNLYCRADSFRAVWEYSATRRAISTARYSTPVSDSTIKSILATLDKGVMSLQPRQVKETKLRNNASNRPSAWPAAR